MSRIGKLPIELPAGVTVSVNGSVVVVNGPKGQLEYSLRPEVSVSQESGVLKVGPKIESKKVSAFLGLTRALIANMVQGVTEGYEKKLELVGVGFRAKQESSNKINMSLGFSHPVIFESPQGVTMEVNDSVNITVRGTDKHLVGLTASKMRKIRKPEPYKGKGIKYAGEIVRRKQGKSGKV